MPQPSYRLATSDPTLEAAFDAIREEFDVPGAFPPEVYAEAEQAAADLARDDVDADLPDATDLPFLTIDPPGSMDLDQAMHLERDGDGYRVRYAIADLSRAVEPGGAIDTEARRRTQTFYLPDGRAPLHPTVISEDACSLLPGVIRTAYVWDIRLDAEGLLTEAHVARARVRSIARYDYEQVQAIVDGGAPSEEAGSDETDPACDAQLPLLIEIGERRIEAERARGGASLPMPSQEIVRDDDGTYRPVFRPMVPVEDHNAQISLLTGMAAADMMLAAGVGILRTMPEPDERDVNRFRRQARALDVTWEKGQPYGEFLRTLDRENPRHLALIHAATSLFRGAAYTVIDGGEPEVSTHSAIAAPYAHVTAPLRRLVDRFGLAVCEAIDADEEVPAWVREALPDLPELMREGDRRSSAVSRAATDAVEAAEVVHRVGEEFDAVVVDDRGDRGLLVQVPDPAIVAPADGEAELGSAVRVVLREADVQARRVRFEVSSGS
ncbi:MAG: RNB domain-containing ribonuclease [Mobilicoccus sp.]|nr:RNB domain-containing ribonuclease [Mobilicoccus sp.]